MKNNSNNNKKDESEQNERKCSYGPYIFIWIVPTENNTLAQMETVREEEEKIV